MEKKEKEAALRRTGERRVHTNGVEIAYETFGDRGDPPVLLIMGLSTQMIMWEDEFCQRLAGRGFFVIRFDNRDVGMSTKLDMSAVPDFNAIFPGRPAGVPYTLHDMTYDTLGLMDSLDISRAHIVGASMGGMIAQLLALKNPLRVHTLTLIMSSSGNPFLPPPKPEALRVLLRPIPLQRDKYIEHFLETWGILNGAEIPIDRARLRRLAECSFERGVSPGGSARQLAAILSSGSRKGMLSAISIPTLVVHGDADPLLPIECGADLAEGIPGSRLKVIKGMGHALPPAVWSDVINAIVRHIHTCSR